MARRKSLFRQQDATRAVRAVHAAGLEVQRVEIAPDGRITIIPGKSEEQSEPVHGGDEWANI